MDNKNGITPAPEGIVAKDLELVKHLHDESVRSRTENTIATELQELSELLQDADKQRSLGLRVAEPTTGFPAAAQPDDQRLISDQRALAEQDKELRVARLRRTTEPDTARAEGEGDEEIPMVVLNEVPLRPQRPITLESIPGAHAIPGVDDAVDRDTEHGMEDDIVAPTEDANEGLVRAKPVQEDNFNEADEVDMDEERNRSHRRYKTARRKLVKGWVLVSLVIVGIAVGVIVALRKDDDDDSKTATIVAASVPVTAPSEASSPTAAPTTYILDFPTFTLEALAQPNSAQSKAYSWLLNDPHLETYPAWRQMQRFAMVTLYYSTNGANWERNDDWLNYEVSECDWLSKGNIRLQLMGLKGTLTRLLLDLFKVWKSYYGYEDFGGFFEGGDDLEYYDYPCGASAEQEQGDPDAQFRLRRFWLHNNKLNGPIPKQFGLLTSLEVWSMAHNPGFRGTFPTEISGLSNLQYVQLEDCGFTRSLPSQIGMLSSLRILSLSVNSGMRGQIPSEIGLLGDSLMFFDVPITEPLPTEIGMLSSLEFFMPLGSTAEMGSIPSELGLLTNLKLMNIVDSPFIEGPIPSELGLLTLLEMGQIRGTSVSGSLPSELGQLSRLEICLFDQNSLTGTIPTEFGLMTALDEFVVEGNPLEGPLPSSVGDANWTNLTLLSLADTFVTGTMPEHACLFTLALMFDCSETLCGCNCAC